MKKAEDTKSYARSPKYNVATPENLLNAAEQLFASQHFDGVSLKMIADRAGANVGQIVYHFGRKEELLRRTVMRRGEVLNQDRRRLLENYQKLVGEKNVQLAPLIRAFLEPYYERLCGDDKQWRYFALFISRTFWDNRVSTYMSECFDDVTRLYLDAFQAAAPTLTRRDAICGYQFMLAAMHSSTAMEDRFRLLLNEHKKSDKRVTCPSDYREYYTRVVPFIAGGFEALR